MPDDLYLYDMTGKQAVVAVLQWAKKHGNDSMTGERYVGCWKLKIGDWYRGEVS